MDPALLRAMIRIVDLRPLQLCINQATCAPNNSEFAGISKWVLRLTPANDKQLQPCLDFMRYVDRLNLKGKLERDVMNSFFLTRP